MTGKPKELIRLAIVDDDLNERTLMKRSVDGSRRLECVGLYSGGIEALKRIPFSACEVVLMDVRMPDISGFECTRELKCGWPHLFIIMISGLDHPDAFSQQAQEAGADACLEKPFSVSRFFQALTACLRRRRLGGGDASTHEIQPQSTEAPGHDLVADESSMVRNALHRIVIAFEENFHAREDLFQEAQVHFWLTVRQCPG